MPIASAVRVSVLLRIWSATRDLRPGWFDGGQQGREAPYSSAGSAGGVDFVNSPVVRAGINGSQTVGRARLTAALPS